MGGTDPGQMNIRGVTGFTLENQHPGRCLCLPSVRRFWSTSSISCLHAFVSFPSHRNALSLAIYRETLLARSFLLLTFPFFFYRMPFTSFGEGNGNPLQYSCLENPMGWGAWWAAVHGVARSPTRLSDFTFTFHFHALEKEMATHSSVLAWRIPGTGEPGGLLSMGSHRVGCDWTNLAAAAFTSFIAWITICPLIFFSVM